VKVERGLLGPAAVCNAETDDVQVIPPLPILLLSLLLLSLLLLFFPPASSPASSLVLTLNAPQ